MTKPTDLRRKGVDLLEGDHDHVVGAVGGTPDDDGGRELHVRERGTVEPRHGSLEAERRAENKNERFKIR
jgi:hypothetical protein